MRRLSDLIERMKHSGELEMEICDWIECITDSIKDSLQSHEERLSFIETQFFSNIRSIEERIDTIESYNAEESNTDVDFSYYYEQINDKLEKLENIIHKANIININNIFSKYCNKREIREINHAIQSMEKVSAASPLGRIFHKAVCNNDFHIVENLLPFIDINEKHEDGNTALFTAMKNNFQETTQVLVDNGAILNPEEVNSAPMEVQETIRAEIERRKPHNFIDSIFKAVSKNNIESIKYLIQFCGVSVEEKSNKESTPLHRACIEGKYDIVLCLVDTFNANINASNAHKKSPLHCACWGGNVDIIKYLIEEKNANIEERDNKGSTPLHKSVANGKLDAVKYLIDKGAIIESKDDIGETPLHKASLFGQLDIVIYLISKGANVNIEDTKGKTPFAVAKDNVKEYLQTVL